MIEAVELGGIRTVVAVPMLKDNALIGVIAIHRREVLPFTDKQIAVLTNFAAQAVIAIENARLLNELRQRTSDLTESLEQQTATSEVLQVISSFPGDLQPVFASMLENAVRICDATFGNIYRWDGGALHLVAARNTPPAFAAEARRRSQYRPDPKTVTGRMLATKAVVHIACRNGFEYAGGTCFTSWPSTASSRATLQCVAIPASMPMRQGGKFASLDVMRPRETFSRMQNRASTSQ